ncbi:hypothetical protein T484DRAFT_1794546 [Baffinella frigidus]|nr:hypothetical protein T484DRAFT_1794546 [Cryptophyta sp. CCMP2293]
MAPKAVLLVGGAGLLACLALLVSLSPHSGGGRTSLEYKPPWEQTPTHFNRYRFARKAGAAAKQQLMQEPAAPAARAARAMAWAAAEDKAAKRVLAAAKAGKKVGQAPRASAPKAPHAKFLTGKQIVGNMFKSLNVARRIDGGKASPAAPRPGKRASKRFKQALIAKYKKAAGATKLGEAGEDDDEEEEEEPEEVPEIDVNDDPPAGSVYVYRGRETNSGASELLTFILAGGMEDDA